MSYVEEAKRDELNSWFTFRHILFAAPLILLHLGVVSVFLVGISSIAIALFFVTSLVQLFGITAGFHRLLAHRSYKTSRTFQFIVATLGVLAGQNGPLWWVAHHRHHHQHSDSEQDTHSPIRGFFWSHMGWLLSPECIPLRRSYVADLEKLPEIKLLQRYYYAVNLGYALLLFLVGEAYQGANPASNVDGWQLVVWGSVLSTVFVYHCIWSANSICHKFGSRQFPTKDDSRNNAIVALLTLGDGWHHNHHYCPSSARHGFFWWQIDINYLILRILAVFGIVWDIRLPPRRAYQA